MGILAPEAALPNEDACQLLNETQGTIIFPILWLSNQLEYNEVGGVFCLKVNVALPDAPLLT